MINSDLKTKILIVEKNEITEHLVYKSKMFGVDV